MEKDKEEKLMKILVSWNAREITHKNAIRKVYNLLDKNVRPYWIAEMTRRAAKNQVFGPKILGE